MSVCCVLSGRGLCDELTTRPEEALAHWGAVMPKTNYIIYDVLFKVGEWSSVCHFRGTLALT
jgi:hypothetical protein